MNLSSYKNYFSFFERNITIETLLDKLLISTFSKTVMITVFVLIMMVLIEYINIQSKNLVSEKLRQSPFMQIFIAALLGITPGCIGAFTVVSLYTHRMMGLAGLVAVMIATSGDEAFVMFALFPGKALILHGVLFAIAILAGWLVNLFSRNTHDPGQHGFVIHEYTNCKCFSNEMIIPQLKKSTFDRALLLLFTIVFIILLVSGIT
jgi:hypothetical protein